MSFHFCAHTWEVRDTEDGTLVQLTRRDVDAEAVSLLVEELFNVVQESGRPNLYLDLGNVHMLTSLLIGKMIALNKLLREHNGRLTLTNLNPVMIQMLRAVELTEVLDVLDSEM